MKKISPSKLIEQKISSLLSRGLSGDVSILTELVKKGVQRLLQEALEQNRIPCHRVWKFHQRIDKPHEISSPAL
jgi:hypothetical protein